MNPIIVEKTKKALLCVKQNRLALVILLLTAVLLVQFVQLHMIKTSVEKDSVLKGRQIQRLDAGIDFQNKRSQFLMVARDSIIMKHNKGLTDGEAYSIAEYTLYICEKYKLDPVLLFAVGRQESKFDVNAVSSEGAKGMYQLFPLTARMLCDGMGMVYSEPILFDLKSNSELAGKYLSYLKAEYNDMDLVLIGYNAGPRWVENYRHDKNKLPDETKDYILQVRNYYLEFSKLLTGYLPGSITQG